MPRLTIDRAVELHVWECGGCGITYAVTVGFVTERQRDGEPFYCPNGCLRGYGNSESDKLREELARAAKRLEMEETRRAAAESSLTATRGVVTRMRNRVGNGVCPCCNRSFCDLARHMQSKHPGFKDEVTP